MGAALLTITNLLPEDFPQRGRVEAAVRDVFGDIPGTVWSVTLRDGHGITASDSVAVEVRSGSTAVAVVSVNAGDSRVQIADCLRFFKLKV
jgi:hypothetical protein